MSEYYTPPDDLVPFTKARARDINELKDSVEVGFDNLPTALGDLKQEIIDAREGRASLIERLVDAEEATAADVVSCQGLLSDCQTEVSNCQTEVSNCQTEVSNCQTEVVNCATQAVIATEQALIAGKYANSMVFNPEHATSSTTMIIGAGTKVFVINTGKSFVQSLWIVIINATNPTQYMKGYINSYDPGSGDIEVSVVQTNGVGNSSSNWLVVHTTPALPSEYSPVSFKGIVVAEMF